VFCKLVNGSLLRKVLEWINEKICSFLFTALGGVNIKALLDGAADEVGGKLLLDFNDTMGDRIQVFLE
jgi:hypothetical protein